MSNNSTPPPEARKSILNWFEIPVSNIPKALALYSAMLDAKLEATDYGPKQMVILGSNGCLINTAKGKVPVGGTVVYLNAHDGVKACLARALEAGAKVVLPETAIGAHGTIGQIEDLDGNIVGLHAEPTK
jgi:predicted enzyme related to lactoylglutathione lyase